MDDHLIISFVKDYPFLYNTRVKDYKNKQKKERTWTNIALSLGYDVKAVKRRWKVLRDRFVRRLKTCDSREIFARLPHYSQLSFLTNIVSHRWNNSKTLENSSDEIEELEDNDNEMFEDAVEIKEEDADYAFALSDTYYSSATEDINALQEKNENDSKYLSYSDLVTQNVSNCPTVSDDVHFLLSLRKSFSKITDERKKTCLKGEILNLLQDYLE